MYYNYYTDEIRDRYALFDLLDLQYDDPKLLSRIIDEAIGMEFSSADINETLWRETELGEINRLIIETSSELLGLSKSKVLDNELNKLKTEFYWQNISTDEKIETIFWRDCYDGFVSFMRRHGKPKMTDIFDLDISDIKNAGFSTHYISEIVSIFTQWAERILNEEVDVGETIENTDIEVDETEERQESSETEDTLKDLMSMFFHLEENG